MADLVHFNAARQQLSLAHSIDEVKVIRDKAEALRQYIKQQGESLEMQNQCAEIKIRAERRAGELLAEQVSPGNPQLSHRAIIAPPKLKDLGISASQSSRWQSVATIPEPIFEQHVAAVKARGEELTSASILQLASRVQHQDAIKDLSRIEQQLTSTTKYRCIVIDPPWPVQKIERDVRPMQGNVLDYPTMTIDEISVLPILEQADPEGCHVYLWVTHKYLPVGLQLFERWGCSYQCLMTWVKNVGFTPFSWMYSTEHVLFGRIGHLGLLRMGLRLDFTGTVREHSRKPESFYDLVREASPEPRLELFAREERIGFDSYGNETGRFSPVATGQGVVGAICP